MVTFCNDTRCWARSGLSFSPQRPRARSTVVTATLFAREHALREKFLRITTPPVRNAGYSHPPSDPVGTGGGDPACTAVTTAVLTMSWAVQPLDRSLAGFFNPCSTGPMACAPASRSTSL